MSKIKSSINSILGMKDTDTNDELLDFSDGEEEGMQLYEIFLSGGETAEDDGLIWKDVLREGQWAYRPGPGQKPTPVPLKVVAGHASDEKEIGMADLVEAYEDHAIDHVTVPTSHDDKPHENTGFVKALRIAGPDGKKTLKVGIDFTEKEIKGKALRGSIANTSAGIIFDYIKKDSGKKYRQALGHVALTNKPWLNGMTPFGVNASENYSDEEFDIVPLMLSDVVWDSDKSFTWLRDQVNREINKDGGQFYVTDITANKALITKFDGSSGSDDNFVVPFQVRGGEIKVPAEEKWIKASREWVEASLSEEKTYVKNNLTQILGDDESLSEQAPYRGAVGDPETGGKLMGSENKNEKEVNPGATSDDPAQDKTDLSESSNKEALDQLRAEFSERNDSLSEENQNLRKKVHAMEVDKRVGELKEAGFSEHPGLLSEIRDLMLADDGKPALVLSLSEEGKEDKEIALSATGVIERIINVLPKSEDGKLNFSDQAISTEDINRPSLTPDNTDLSEEDRTAALAEGLGIELPKDGDA